MKRFHMHVAVKDLEENVRFYSTLFGAAPTVHKPLREVDARRPARQLRHLDAGRRRGSITSASRPDRAELEDVHARLARADGYVDPEGRGVLLRQVDKYSVEDPRGIASKAWRTLEEIPVTAPARAQQQRQGGCVLHPAKQEANGLLRMSITAAQQAYSQRSARC